MAGLQPVDPLKKVMPQVGAPVQNLGGMAPNTAPVESTPVAAPAVRTGTPGPVNTGGFTGVGDNSQIPTPLGSAQGSLQTATQPAAPAQSPAPAAAAAPVASPTLYGSGGGGSPTSLEDQIRGYITGGLNGVTSKAFIDRAKNQLGSAVEGQRAQGVNRINEDAIRRGLFKSGIPAEGVAAAETGARGALSSGIADILSKAEQQDIAGRESAAGTAGNLLGMNRSWDQYQNQRADEAAARAAANQKQDTTFQYQDPDTGQTYTMDQAWFQ